MLPGPFPTMLRAGDGARSSRGATAVSTGLGNSLIPSFVGDRFGQPLVDVKEVRIIRSRMTGVSTLLKVSAMAICFCSGAAWLLKNWHA